MKIKRLYASLKAKMSLLHTIVLLMIVLFSASSCNEADLFSQSFNDFPQNRWHKTNTLEANFSVPEDGKIADINLRFSYVYGSQFSEIPLEIYFTAPNHQIEKIPVILHLRGANNEELGDCVGDYCDMTFKVKDDYKFTNKGEYKVQVLHAFGHHYIPNVLAISLNVEVNNQ